MIEQNCALFLLWFLPVHRLVVHRLDGLPPHPYSPFLLNLCRHHSRPLSSHIPTYTFFVFADPFVFCIPLGLQAHYTPFSLAAILRQRDDFGPLNLRVLWLRLRWPLVNYI